MYIANVIIKDRTARPNWNSLLYNM